VREGEAKRKKTEANSKMAEAAENHLLKAFEELRIAGEEIFGELFSLDPDCDTFADIANQITRDGLALAGFNVSVANLEDPGAPGLKIEISLAPRTAAEVVKPKFTLVK
jgi:hypothetical protein